MRLSSLLVGAAVSAFCAGAFAYDILIPSEKAQYKERNYYDICREASKLVKSHDECKAKFKIVYKGKSDALPQKYEDFSKVYGVVLPDGESPEARGYARMPILYFMAKSKLRDQINDLTLDKPVMLYATLRYRMYKDPKRKEQDERIFYLQIDDLEPALTDAPAKDKESLDSVKDSDFAPANARKLDIQYDKLLDAKVSISLRFMDIDNKLPNELLKLTDMSNETHFLIVPAESFHTPIVVARDNERCVDPLLEARTGDPMTLRGTLRKADDLGAQKKTSVYYFLVYSLSLEKGSPQAQGSADANTAEK